MSEDPNIPSNLTLNGDQDDDGAARTAAGVTAAAAAAAGKGDENLAAEIARTVPREPLEQVTCRRVAPNHYRCNWWTRESTTGYDNPAMPGGLVMTSKICKSRFLRATKTKQEGLKITGI